jgi:hypothetical protein
VIEETIIEDAPRFRSHIDPVAEEQKPGSENEVM